MARLSRSTVNVPSPLFTMKCSSTLAPPPLWTHRSTSPSLSMSPDVADLMCRSAGFGEGASCGRCSCSRRTASASASECSNRPLGVLRSNCGGLPYPAALRPDVDAGIEDREVETAVVVEVIRDRDRRASPDRGQHSRRRRLELPSAGAEEHLHRQPVQSVFDRLAAVVRLTAGDDVVPAVPVQVRHGDDDLDPVEAALGLDARERLRMGGSWRGWQAMSTAVIPCCLTLRSLVEVVP